MSSFSKKSNSENKPGKKVKFSTQVGQKHWVGDGFHVHGLLRPSPELNKYISPFILMDYAPPKVFAQSTRRRGVGVHPHRGFETVTFAYQGEVEHRDSSGGGGIIKPGDIQWMTAGKGVVHDEFHSTDFSKRGGTFEMVQLWVNLPSKNKMTNPKYQNIKSKDVPTVSIGKHTTARIISGKLNNTKGPASTFTKINLFDLKANKDDRFFIEIERNTNTVLLILNGEAIVDSKKYKEHSMLIFEQEGYGINFEVTDNFKALLLNGEPINERVVAHGPFVMNTEEEIKQAIIDYQSGKMGSL